MISALVVNHNAWHHLERCLEHLLGPSVSGIGEVVVADNASRDGSVEAVRRRFPGVRLLSFDENLGFGAANNRAAEVARGELLLLVNSDAWLEPGSLPALERRLRKDDSLAAVAPRLCYPDGRRQFHWAPATGVRGEALQKLRNRWEHRAFSHREPPRWCWWLLGAPWYTAACLLVRRRAFEEIGGFDEGFFLYFEDVDLCVRWRRAGWGLATAGDALAYHVKGGSRRSWRSELEYRRSQLRYYQLHRPPWEQAVIHRRLRRKLSKLGETGQREAFARLLDEDQHLDQFR